MVGYLQSKDYFTDRLRVGPNENEISVWQEDKVSEFKLIGSFASISGKRVLFYRWEDDLRIRFNDDQPISLSYATVKWLGKQGKAEFTIDKDGSRVVEIIYPINENIRNIETDPTPFAEAEDFDILLFVSNVLGDDARASRIYK